MAVPPRISVRGLRAKSFPTGYVVGRSSRGKGDLELLSLGALKGFGLATGASAGSKSKTAGFGFHDEGLFLNNEFLGAAVFPFDVTFTDGDPLTVVSIGNAATVDSTFDIIALDASNIPFLGGTILCAAGSLVGVVTWTGGVLVNLAGKPLSLNAPSPADVTLANVSGIVTGKK